MLRILLCECLSNAGSFNMLNDEQWIASLNSLELKGFAHSRIDSPPNSSHWLDSVMYIALVRFRAKVLKSQCYIPAIRLRSIKVCILPIIGHFSDRARWVFHLGYQKYESEKEKRPFRTSNTASICQKLIKATTVRLYRHNNLLNMPKSCHRARWLGRRRHSKMRVGIDWLLPTMKVCIVRKFCWKYI